MFQWRDSQVLYNFFTNFFLSKLTFMVKREPVIRTWYRTEANSCVTMSSNIKTWMVINIYLYDSRFIVRNIMTFWLNWTYLIIPTEALYRLYRIEVKAIGMNHFWYDFSRTSNIIFRTVTFSCHVRQVQSRGDESMPWKYNSCLTSPYFASERVYVQASYFSCSSN